MKIVKMVFIWLVMAVPVALGGFYYGRTVGSHPYQEEGHDQGEGHGEKGHDEGAHGEHPEDREQEHGQDSHEAKEPESANADEDHVLLSEDQIRALGVVVAEAGPGKLETALTLPGEIILNDDAYALVTPYVSGYVREIRKRQGDAVRKGEVMAVLESRELADAGAAYLAARERVLLAEKTFQRETSLWRKKISPEQDYNAQLGGRC